MNDSTTIKRSSSESDLHKLKHHEEERRHSGTTFSINNETNDDEYKVEIVHGKDELQLCGGKSISKKVITLGTQIVLSTAILGFSLTMIAINPTSIASGSSFYVSMTSLIVGFWLPSPIDHK